MDADLIHMLQRVVLVALPLLFAVTLHEAAHGWMADKKGDSTARRLGRITANPLAHIDPVGTVILPLILMLAQAPFLFGWAKPVPVNFLQLRRPKIDMAWVAAAGPGANLLLAGISAVLCHAILLIRPEFSSVLNNPAFFLPRMSTGEFSILLPILLMLKMSVDLNILLMLFNLLPVPPLDGGRIAVGLLPHRQAAGLARVEPYGMLIVIGLVFLDPGGVMRNFFWPAISSLSHWMLVR